MQTYRVPPDFVGQSALSFQPADGTPVLEWTLEVP